MTATHPPLNTMGWWLVRLKTSPEFWKVPLCSTLWCNCFSLNAGHSLFDDDDVIFLMILPGVQIFRPKSPELINLLWIKTWCPSSLPHWNQLITNKWLSLYFTIQWKSFSFIVVFHWTKSHEFSVCPKVILSLINNYCRNFKGHVRQDPTYWITKPKAGRTHFFTTTPGWAFVELQNCRSTVRNLSPQKPFQRCLMRLLKSLWLTRSD